MLNSYRRLSRNTTILSASIGAVLLSFFTWNALLPLHLRALGATDVEIGVIFSLIIVIHTAPSIIGGLLADRIGRRALILGPGYVLALLYVLAGLTTDWRLFTVLLLAANFFGSLQWPAMQALVSESDEKERAIAFSLIEVFVQSAAVAGPLLGALLLPYLGVHGLIVLYGLVMALLTVVRALVLRETRIEPLPHEPHAANRRTAITRPVLSIVAAYALASLALGLSAGGPFMAMLSRDVWGLSDQQIQTVMSFGSLAAFGGIWLGSRADRWGGRRLWMMSIVGFSISLAGWGLSPNALIGALFIASSTLFFEAVFIISETLLAHRTTPATRSFLFGLLNTVGGTTEAAGPAIGTGLISLWHLPATFLAAGLVGIVSLVTLHPLGKEQTVPNVPTVDAAD